MFYKRILFLFVLLSCTLYFKKSFCSTHQNIADSLLKLLPSLKEDTHKVAVLLSVSKQFVQSGDSKQAIQYANKALYFSEKLNFNKGVADAFNSIGVIYYREGNYQEALNNYFRSLSAKEKSGDKKGSAKSYRKIAVIYDQLGNYPDALKNQFLGLKICEEINDFQAMASAYNNIGVIYIEQNNYSEAQKNISQSLTLSEKANDLQGIADACNNMGIVFSNQKMYAESLKYHLRALKIRQEIGDKDGIAHSYSNVGLICYEQKNYDDALKYHLQSLNIKEEMGNKAGVAYSSICVGEVYTSIGKYAAAATVKKNSFENAQNYIHRGWLSAKQLGSKDDVQEAYSAFTELDTATGDFKKAFEDYKLCIVYRDSLLNEENTKKITQAGMQYEFDKKEMQTKSEQEKKDAIQNAESRKQKMILMLVSGFLILVILFSLFIYRSLLQIRKINIEITKQKHIIEEKQKEILDSIHYAKRIQTALLPSEKYIEKTLNRLKKKTPQN